MQRASTLFSDEQKQRIDQAVTRAESGTSAEIVPAVATASGRYDRAEDIAGFWLAMMAMAAVWWFLPTAVAEHGSWDVRPRWVDLAALIGAALAGFIVGAVVTSRVGWLRRLFTLRSEMGQEVGRRARQVFFDGRVHHTAGKTGLLVYVSLYERMAIVLGDEQVEEKLGHAALDELCAALTRKLREGDVCAALCETIEAAGKRLAPVLPIAADDRNEISNAVITVD